MTQVAPPEDEPAQSRLEARKAQENKNLFARMPAVYAASRRQGQNLLKQSGGLSIVEWRTLWDLHDVGPLTIRELAMLQRMDHSLLSRALPQMRDKGYVTMRRDERDGRQTVVELAPKGHALYSQAAPVMANRRKALRDTFSQEEIETFVSLIDRFETFLRGPIEHILDTEER